MRTPLLRHDFQPIGRDEFVRFDRLAIEYISRAQASPVYLGDHTVLCRVLARFKMFVDSRDTGFGCNVMLDGFWELWLTMVIARIVRPGMTVVDIGANYGYYSLLMADRVGPSGRMIGVEPNPAARALLERTLHLNGFTPRSTIVAAAAGATSAGHVALYVPDGEPKNATVVEAIGVGDPARGRTVEVPLWSLDAVRDESGRIDFVKIDAEGSEPAILDGMRDTLRRDRPGLVLEYNPVRYPDPGLIPDMLTAIYGGLHAVMKDGTTVPITREEAIHGSGGEDWLLVCGIDPETWAVTSAA